MALTRKPGTVAGVSLTFYFCGKKLAPKRLIGARPLDRNRDHASPASTLHRISISCNACPSLRSGSTPATSFVRSAYSASGSATFDLGAEDEGY